MKDTLEYIIKAIVEKPKEVAVSETAENDVTEFIIRVDKDDMGRVIGKGGKVIRAIRNVMKIPAIKENKRIHISLSDEV